jgi:hypothetical protein
MCQRCVSAEELGDRGSCRVDCTDLDEDDPRRTTQLPLRDPVSHEASPLRLRMRMHWIIVCEHFHGAVGPIPTEQLAAELAAYASEIGECTYRPVRLELAQARGPGQADDEDAIGSAV